MRISDWSSDVCSSDLADTGAAAGPGAGPGALTLAPFNRLPARGAASRIHRAASARGALLRVARAPDSRTSAARRCASRAVARASARDFHPPCAATVRPAVPENARLHANDRSEEHTSELQSLMRISYAVFCLKK